MRTSNGYGKFGVVLAATALAVTAGLVLQSVQAQNGYGHPSAKATAQCADTYLIEATDGQEWTTLLSNTMHTPNQKDLLITASLESGLYTSTEVSSKNGKRDSSTATAAVKVRVLINGVMADPGEITYASRTQVLSAVFQGLIDGCLYLDENGNIILDEECVDPEEVSLILDTMTANSFNFVFPDCPQGVHTIEVQAKIETNAVFDQGGADALALVGKGTMTVEEVRMIRNEDILLE